jgi:alkanesulfonate monooxygenase SsuD/methylene tetrahydromethanopterin reductase-like flavin-dependent oxidoreductase (luciferase family)
MRLSYMIDTHAGKVDGPPPTPAEMDRSMEGFLEEAEIADRLGFYSLNIPDRHMRGETHFPNPLQLLTALAVRTHQCKLTTYSLVATLYHPMHIAEQAAMIDNLSKGRLILAMGMGFSDEYWRMFGLTRTDRKKRFIETLDILDLAFKSPEYFDYRGSVYDLEQVRLTPPPYQPGGPEIWLGGEVDASIERAGARADAWCVDSFPLDPVQWSRRSDLYRRTAELHGRPPKIVLLREAWVADTHEEAIRFCQYMAEEHLWYVRNGFPLGIHPDFPTIESITAENWAKHAVVGTAEECAEKLARYRDEFGADEVSLRLRRAGGPGFGPAKECLHRFGEEVLPLVASL